MKNALRMVVIVSGLTALGGCVAVPVQSGYYEQGPAVYAPAPAVYVAPPVIYGPPVYYGPSIHFGIQGGRGGHYRGGPRGHRRR